MGRVVRGMGATGCAAGVGVLSAILGVRFGQLGFPLPNVTLIVEDDAGLVLLLDPAWMRKSFGRAKARRGHGPPNFLERKEVPTATATSTPILCRCHNGGRDSKKWQPQLR